MYLDFNLEDNNNIYIYVTICYNKNILYFSGQQQ